MINFRVYTCSLRIYIVTMKGLTLTCVLMTLCLAEDATTKPYTPSFPPGDIRRCLLEIPGQKFERYEVLPGTGWDNIQNKDAGLLVYFNYSECKTTDDGRYLIPDNVFTVPIKSSRLEVFGELFQHWVNYTSTTSSSINVHGGLNIGHFGISGKYSHESESIRKHQVGDKSVTTRVQARYVRYSAKLQPDTPLSPAFKERLKSIAYNIQINKTTVARYDSQLLVRDFGTHVITSIDAGSILSQLDQVKSQFVFSGKIDKSQVVAAASASFMSIFSIGAEYKHSISKQLIDQYTTNLVHSSIKTFGGPVFKPTNFTLNQWASQIGDDLVAVDRSGIPIYELINAHALQEIPPSILFSLSQLVKNAVEDYYKYNIYRGCTNPDSPNFSFIANVDDGTCESSKTNYSFGGVYQTCSQSGSLYQNLCNGLVQKNPLTGSYSCPEGYESILLNKDSKTGSESRRSCHHCGFLGLSHCCDNYVVYGQAHFSAYWCFAKGHISQQSGFEFGGIYTSKSNNPVTQSQNCPLYFYPLKLGMDMHVCVSDEYELGYAYSVPFAGLFSCISGNPLAITTGDNKVSYKDSEAVHSLTSYLRSSEPNHWPRGCPNGYSMHLAAIENSCEIHFCVKAHAFSDKGLPAIRRPPFMQLPSNAFLDSYSESTVNSYLISKNGQTWIMNEKQEDDISNGNHQEAPNQSSNPEVTQGLSPTIVAVISVISTLVVIGIVGGLIYRFKKRGNLYRELNSQSGLSSKYTAATSQYGTSGGTTEVRVET